ncbi:MAG: general secretion pathway protein GspF [Pseudomonadota bacterium]|nr:MAG: general secretion pathway protein GspF [Pseudomonadota bacterium]
MQEVNTIEDYIELVEQALFEVKDLRMSAEYDVEEMGDALGFVDDLDRGVRELLNALKDGTHRFGGDDLPFMAIVRQQSDLVLPFKGLLRDINNAHRKGLSQT